MGVVNFNVSLRLSPIQRTFIQFENVSTEISITDLKNEIINKGGLEKSCELGINIIFIDSLLVLLDSLLFST